MIEILDAGFYTTVQDLGRWGWQRFGVPVGGAMDTFALRAANQLVGNPWQSAVLETSLGGLRLRCWQDCLITLAGCGADLWVSGSKVPTWMAVRVPYAAEVQVRSIDSGGWNCLAVSGGLDVPVVLGSRSSYPRAGLGLPPLKNGDTLPLGRPGTLPLPGRYLPPEARPAYNNTPELLVIPGPQQEDFTQEAMQILFSSAYTLRSDSDRMGYRFSGPALTRCTTAELLSEGMTAGSIQVPANGQPLVMMSDCPTTGGYPKIAAVCSASLPLLAQCPPGAQVRFRPVSVDEAHNAWRALLAGLQNGVLEPEEAVLGMIQ